MSLHQLAPLHEGHDLQAGLHPGGMPIDEAQPDPRAVEHCLHIAAALPDVGHRPRLPLHRLPLVCSHSCGLMLPASPPLGSAFLIVSSALLFAWISLQIGTEHACRICCTLPGELQHTFRVANCQPQMGTWAFREETGHKQQTTYLQGHGAGHIIPQFRKRNSDSYVPVNSEDDRNKGRPTSRVAEQVTIGAMDEPPPATSASSASAFASGKFLRAAAFLAANAECDAALPEREGCATAFWGSDLAKLMKPVDMAYSSWHRRPPSTALHCSSACRCGLCEYQTATLLTLYMQSAGRQ